MVRGDYLQMCFYERGGGRCTSEYLKFNQPFYRYLKKCLIESELLSMKKFEVFGFLFSVDLM